MAQDWNLACWLTSHAMKSFCCKGKSQEQSCKALSQWSRTGRPPTGSSDGEELPETPVHTPKWCQARAWLLLPIQLWAYRAKEQVWCSYASLTSCGSAGSICRSSRAYDDASNLRAAATVQQRLWTCLAQTGDLVRPRMRLMTDLRHVSYTS